MDNEEQAIGVCCADFYSHPLVHKLLDGMLHPGGLALSSLMAKKMFLGPHSTVLDVACGDGTTATYIAKKTGAKVWGIDVGEEMIQKARAKADEMAVAGLVDFQVALAGNLPFDDGVFSDVYTECSVCTLLNKQRAAGEIARVMKPGGSLGVSDVTLHSKDELDEELQGLFGRVACIADALPAEGYIELFKASGFTLADATHHAGLLTNLVSRAESNARLLKGMTGDSRSDEVNPKTLNDVLRVCGLLHEQIASKNLSYALFIFRKK